MSLKAAMTWLGQQRDTLFIGQGLFAGTRMSADFADVPKDRLLEFPVAEEMQLGAALGMSLEGHCVIAVYPRWNFLLLAANQLVNHLDRLPLYSGYRPRVIIRVAVGSREPLDPGPQHADDFTEAFEKMVHTVQVVDLRHAKPVYKDKRRSEFVGMTALHGEEIVETYKRLYAWGVSAIVVEDACC